MTRRLAERLLRTAARRWPAEVRDELSREWHAELHVLAERGERLRMLRFAGSLAVGRARVPLVARSGLDGPFRRTVATLLLAPHREADPRRAGPGALARRPDPLAVRRGAAGRPGRVRAAWLVGVLGALVAADLAVVLTVVNLISGGPETVIDGVAQGDTVDRVSAPLWLFTSWTDWSFGLPRPTKREIFLITDLVELQPFLYLACTPYALAYAIRAARPAAPEPIAPPAPVPSGA